MNDENQELKTENKELKRKALDMEMDRDYYRTKSASLEEGYLQLQRENDENKKLKQDLKDCKKLAGKRLNKNRNHRAVIEDLGGSIRAYKGQISQLNEKIEKIQEAIEDTGALTKRQLEEILND